MEEDDKRLAIETTDHRPQTTGNTIAVVSSGSELEKVKVKSEKLKVNAPVAKSEIRNQKSEINSIKARNTKSENTKNKSLIASIRVNPFNPRHPRTNVFSKGKKQLATSNKQQHNSKQQTTNSKSQTNYSQLATDNTYSKRNGNAECCYKSVFRRKYQIKPNGSITAWLCF